jgi:DNA integrity scanning protein DisA with diadenylate cyclase activity
MNRIEEKLSKNFLLSKFSFKSDIYKQIVLERENSIKVKDMHFNFMDLLLSIDGAVILDSSFNLLTFGELVKLEGSGTDFGARTNAAISASKYTIAIKISEDGEVTMYDNYKAIIKI